jgi:UDP-N-acetylmuramate dehydrogenase
VIRHDEPGKTGLVPISTTSPLAALTTLAVGGPAEVIQLDDEDQFSDVVAALSDRERPPVCLGWGSNVLASDSAIDVPVLLMRTRGMTVDPVKDSDHVEVTLDAGYSLPDFVDFAAGEHLMGIETLAGVPGTVGAMPIQNVGAYGQETADTLVRLTAWDWQQGREVTFTADECRFGHRTSLFKHQHRWAILTVTFGLTRSRDSAPLVYDELARHLDVDLGTRLPLGDVNAAVIDLRRRKGMVLDPTDSESRSVGSIFASPVITDQQASDLRALGASPHAYPDGPTRVGASWLIRQAGYGLGQPLRPGVRVSRKHFTLVADDGATATNFAAAALSMRDRVLAASGIALTFEPDLIGKDGAFMALDSASLHGMPDQNA